MEGEDLGLHALWFMAWRKKRILFSWKGMLVRYMYTKLILYLMVWVVRRFLVYLYIYLVSMMFRFWIIGSTFRL